MWFSNHFRSILSGGDKFKMCALVPFFKYGMAALHIKKVPRTLMSCIRSKRLASVFSVGVSPMADALLINMSMPPKRFTVSSITFCISSSLRISHFTANALPPAASISAAAE